jgi:hypothetical protein
VALPDRNNGWKSSYKMRENYTSTSRTDIIWASILWPDTAYYLLLPNNYTWHCSDVINGWESCYLLRERYTNASRTEHQYCAQVQHIISSCKILIHGAALTRLTAGNKLISCASMTPACFAHIWASILHPGAPYYCMSVCKIIICDAALTSLTAENHVV